MKLINYIKVITIGLLVATSSCSLHKDPLSEFSEVILGSNDDEGERIKYKTRAEVLSLHENLYNTLKERQEHWYLDLLLLAETRADNAYAGTDGAEVVPHENNSLDGGNSVLARDWDRYLSDVAKANAIICNIDSVPDAAFAQAERRQWKAEAKIFRALIMFDMVRIWGNIPVIVQEAGDITAENIEEVYPLYFPEQKTANEAYAQIINDLTSAIPYAPNNDVNDKTKLSKSVARALLAKVYAEKAVQDHDKVIAYADSVIADGFSLVEDYSDLFGLNSDGNDVKMRNTSESILEIQYFSGGGNWVSWMFGRDLLNYDTNFSWAKWVTPSRDLIAAYNSENDQIRKNESIVYYVASWANYYPASNYPFMYKLRSANNSIIKIRLADILLLKAEALAMKGGTHLAEAANIVNQIRARVELEELSAAVKGSQSEMIDAVLKERRLELAFEGQRFFDLVRYGKLQEVMNSINQRDSGRLPQVNPFDSNSELFPIPQIILDANANLVQNPGY